MLTLHHRAGRMVLRTWGRWGKAPGWHYQAVARWGPRLAGDGRTPAVLVNGCRMWCDLRDEVQRQIYFLGAYEPVEAYVFCQLLRPGMTVIDAGANVGQYTLLASTAVGPSGAVYSFEPVPATFARLQEHVRANRLTNVSPVRAALWHEAATLRLGLSHDMSDNRGAYSIGVENPATAVEAPAVRLNDFAARHGLERVGLVKMDIEGAEWFALQGMSSLLRRQRPVVLMEVNRAAAARLGYDLTRLWEVLVADLGYQAWAVGHSAHVCGPLTSFDAIEQQNVLFHREDLPAAVTGGWDLKSVLRWARRKVPGVRGPR